MKGKKLAKRVAQPQSSEDKDLDKIIEGDLQQSTAAIGSIRQSSYEDMSSEGFQYGVGAGVRSLFETSQFSDLEIHCNGTIYKVHKNILACQGGFFSKVSKQCYKEGQTGIIELNDDDPQVLLAVLRFMYGFEYCVPDGVEPAVFHANLYSCAEFYQLPLLKKAAKTSFKKLATDEGVEGAKACFNAAQAVYSGTVESDRGLRDLLVNTINEHIKAVIDEDEGNQLILKDVPDLSYDLVRLRAQKHERKDTTDAQTPCRCPDCEFQFSILNKSGNRAFDFMTGDQMFDCPACGLRYYSTDYLT